jgi:hypothetical protein
MVGYGLVVVARICLSDHGDLLIVLWCSGESWNFNGRSKFAPRGESTGRPIMSRRYRVIRRL